MLPSKPLIGLLALFLTLPALAARPAVLGAHDYAWLKVASKARSPVFAQKMARGLAPSASRTPEAGVAFEQSRQEFIDGYRKAKQARPASLVAQAPVALSSTASQPQPPASALKPAGAQPLAGCSATGSTASVGGGLLLMAWLARERRRVYARARRPGRR
jgi:uncharacterized protein (TIGR03382 family)